MFEGDRPRLEWTPDRYSRHDAPHDAPQLFRLRRAALVTSNEDVVFVVVWHAGSVTEPRALRCTGMNIPSARG